MSTIIDAVNYYGGDKFVFGKHEGHHTHIVKAAGANRFYSACSMDVSGDYAVCTIVEYNKCVEEMISMNIKPVFTQAMADNGELPSVGMECMHLSVKKVIMLPADSNSKYVLKSVNDFYSLAFRHDIKPIDTRTDKEKAFDKFIHDDYNLTVDEFTEKYNDEEFIKSLRSAFNYGTAWSDM